MDVALRVTQWLLLVHSCALIDRQMLLEGASLSIDISTVTRHSIQPAHFLTTPTWFTPLDKIHLHAKNDVHQIAKKVFHERMPFIPSLNV